MKEKCDHKFCKNEDVCFFKTYKKPQQRGVFGKLPFNVCPACKKATFCRSVFGNICSNEECFYEEHGKQFNPKECFKCKKIMKPIIEKDGKESKHSFHCECYPNMFISIG